MAAMVAFAAYASGFLYFFVDDEAIPLIFARNLIRGRGLTYTVLEGRVEGYSDFLHVIWSAGLLTVTRAAGLSPLSPLLVGKAVGVAAALAAIAVTGWFLRRQNAATPALLAALGFLALAGPFAVWACSSLETATFSLLVIAFTAMLFSGAVPAAVVLGIAVSLDRIDGVLFVSTIVLAAAQTDSGRAAKFWLAARWIAVANVLFHAWRYWYFGSLVPAPLAAKVLYHLTGPAHALVKTPDQTYLGDLARVYGPVALVAAALGFCVAAAWQHRIARALVIAVLVLGLYVQLTGDWMFGWRLTVALFPLLAVVIGLAVGRLPSKVAWGAAVVVMLWSAHAAYRFQALYVAGEHKPLFWNQPHDGRTTWLAPYAGIVAAASREIGPGTRIAYNQAGLLPYLLDVENIDDLGICSRFVAGLPTSDIYFTGVGRYSPLTDQPILRTAHAYLLYQDVQFVIARADLLWRANGDRWPDTLLDGYFVRAGSDASGENLIYKRSDKPADRYRLDPSLFTENVAHTTRLTYAAVGGRAVPPDRIGPELPFLREGQQSRTFSGDLEIDVHFPHEATVSGFYIGRIASSGPATLIVTLVDEAGRVSFRRDFDVAPGVATLRDRFDSPVRATAASLRIDATGDDSVTINDVRLEGQSRELREYLRRRLRFPPS